MEQQIKHLPIPAAPSPSSSGLPLGMYHFFLLDGKFAKKGHF